MQATDKFQGKCLVNSVGWQYMGTHFDHFPPRVKKRLHNSPFNICAACVYEATHGDLEADYLDAIDRIEAQIRAEESTTES